MAKMTLADLVSHQEFMDYFNLRMVETSPLIRSGIVSQDPAIAAKCANAGFEGKTVDMPFLNSLDEADDAEVPVEDTAPTGTDKVTAGQDTAVVQFRRKKFGITDVTRILGGVDPARQIIDQMTPYWHKQDQKRLLAILKGIFAANARAFDPEATYTSGTATLAADATVTATGMYGAASLSSGGTVYENGNNGDMILDITGENGNAALLDKNTLMLAAQLLGDHKADLTAIACNSMVDTYLSGIDQNAGLYRASDGPATLAKYNNRDILVDEQAMARALESGHVARYVTDFANTTSVQMQNAIVTTHLGASTREAEENCAVMAANELMDYLENGNITNSVNFGHVDLGRKGTGARICIFNRNVPSMIGRITSAISEAGLNIENMANKASGEVAYMLIELSEPAIDDSLAEKLNAIDGIIRVRVIQ